MISPLAKQGGRRYSQLGTVLSGAMWLTSVGAAPVSGGGETHNLPLIQTGATVGADAGDPSWTGMIGDPGTGVATINTADAIGAHTTVAVFLSADVSAYPADTIDHIDMVATATVSGSGSGLEVSFNSTDAITPVGTLYTQRLILEDVLGWPTVQPTLTVFIETNGVGEVVLTVTEVHLVVTLVPVAPPPPPDIDIVEPAFTPVMAGGGWVSPVRWGTPYNPPPLPYTRPRETPRVTWAGQDDLIAALVARLERDLNRHLRLEKRAIEQAQQLRAARIRAEDDLLILLL